MGIISYLSVLFLYSFSILHCYEKFLYYSNHLLVFNRIIHLLCITPCVFLFKDLIYFKFPLVLVTYILLFISEHSYVVPNGRAHLCYR